MQGTSAFQNNNNGVRAQVLHSASFLFAWTTDQEQNNHVLTQAQAGAHAGFSELRVKDLNHCPELSIDTRLSFSLLM